MMTDYAERDRQRLIDESREVPSGMVAVIAFIGSLAFTGGVLIGFVVGRLWEGVWG